MRSRNRMTKLLFPALALLVSLMAGLTGCVQVDLFGARRGPLVETPLFGNRGPKILMVDIDGIIRQEATASFLSFSESTVARVREQLDVARQDDEVKAVLLRIDTPGGSATAMLYTFKQPGLYAYLNHNLIEAFLLGAAAHVQVEGTWNDDLMKQVKQPGPIREP